MSTLGGPSPVTVSNRNRKAGFLLPASVSRARSASSTNLVSVIPCRAARPLAERRSLIVQIERGFHGKAR